MREKDWKGWKPFVYGGLASVIAELGKQRLLESNNLNSNRV